MQWFGAKPDFENYGLALSSDSEAYFGRLRKSRNLKERAVDSAVRADNNENATIYLTNSAILQSAYGLKSNAIHDAVRATKLVSESLGVKAEASLALAMAGDSALAQSMSLDIGKAYPSDMQVQSIWLPSIRAQLALDRNDPTAAIRELEAASPIELASLPFLNNASCLYHTYIRGQAYLAAGQGNTAAAEFQKILDHSGIVWNCWTGALAHLGVARANALEARTLHGADAAVARTRALAAYNDFLTLWKDADLDIPILKQAKAEDKRLQ